MRKNLWNTKFTFCNSHFKESKTKQIHGKTCIYVCDRNNWMTWNVYEVMREARYATICK